MNVEDVAYTVLASLWSKAIHERNPIPVAVLCVQPLVDVSPAAVRKMHPPDVPARTRLSPIPPGAPLFGATAIALTEPQPKIWLA